MLNLQDNVFNARQPRHRPKLKLWRYLGLMLTYQCNASCRFCYYHCSPQGEGLMSVETAILSWQGLVRIAGNRASIHLTGGEPFLYFDRLADICDTGRKLGLSPVDTIETNAGVWENRADLTDKLRFLDARGLGRLKVSWDAFHEEFVDGEKVRQFVAIARDVLGTERVLVRWEKYLDNPSGIRQMTPQQRDDVMQAALETDACRFTGRAATALAPLVLRFSHETLKGRCCQNALLGARGVHIDPYGNVFSGQCSGIIVGNVTQRPLDALWMTFEPDRAEFWSDLYSKGPAGLLKWAQASDFQLQEEYASKCHLCTDIRRFFFDKQLYSTIIGPSDCYRT